MTHAKAAFSVGQLVHHRLFNYRGVVYDVDPVFEGPEEWYEEVAKTRPPKDRPWYHVLVDGQGVETYVAERNLEADKTLGPIDHPYVDTFFSRFEDGVYHLKLHTN